MATEEKLKYFYDSTMVALKGKNEKELAAMKEKLEADFEKFKKTYDEEVQIQERLHADEAKRELLKELAGEKLKVRRKQSEKEDNIKDRLFTEVGEMLDAFRAGEEYFDYLRKNIMDILEFAGGDDVTIYLCPSDAAFEEKLEAACNVNLTVSDVPFNGGIQAEIPSRNIFINDSFSSRMAEEKRAYIVKA